MNFKEIQELIRLIQKSNLTEFKIKEGEFELSIRTEKYQSGKAPQYIAPAVQPTLQVAPAASPAPAPAAPLAPATQAKAPEQSQEAENPAPSGSGEYIAIKSPMVGTFYRSPSPDKAAYVKVGDMVEKGDVVCIVEAMKLFNEIESEFSGRIVKVMVEDAQPVEYDQVLYLIDPKG
ncbi:MAG: acetyl-CoA carboxylase biotin carboxyl carrier protein [Saprospiraceae bacterium]